MEVVHHEEKIVEVCSDAVVIQNAQDALDLIATLGFGSGIILHKENIAPSFFDLRSGLAGEVLQKFVNYNTRLAIVGDFSNVASASLRALILESNQGSQVGFVESLELAKEFLAKS